MVHSIFLYPIEGNFDVVAIETFLAQRPDVLLDPLGTATYLVCGTPDAKEVFREKRLTNPSEFPYVTLMTVKSDEVNIFQEYGTKSGLRSARSIACWLLKHTRCRVADGYGDDWTERVSQHGVNVLYPEYLRNESVHQ
jgi:hypothetical protein